MNSLTRTGVLLIWMMLPVHASAEDVRETSITQAAERHLPGDEQFMQWIYDPQTQDGDTLEVHEIESVEPETVKLTGVVRPIQFESGVADIPASTVEELRAVLEGMRDRLNVRLNLVGHADNEQLSPRLTAIYGDNLGL